MKNLTSNLVPRCIGRYMIDLPRSFEVNPVGRAVVEDITIEIHPSEEKAFTAAFDARRKLLESQVLPSRRQRHPHLRSTTPLPDGSPGGVFDRAESEASPGRLSRVLELHGWKQGYWIRAHIKASDNTFPEYRGDSLAAQIKTDVAEKLTHLLSVFSRTSGRADHEIPTGTGVCIRHGFIRGQATDQEWIDLNYYLNTAEDVSFTFHYLSHIGPQSNTLLQRGSSIDPALANVNGRTLRKGQRETHGLRPEEWLMERQVDPGVKDYHFTLELNSKFGNAQAPLLVMTFDSGSRSPRPELSPEEAATLKPIHKATLGEAESIVLWDTVLPTLRPRPDAF